MKAKAAEPFIAAVELLRDRVPDFSRYSPRIELRPKFLD